MSGQGTVRSGYRPIQLLSSRVTVSLANISRANVLSGYFLPGFCSRVSVRQASVHSGHCPETPKYTLVKIRFINLRFLLSEKIFVPLILLTRFEILFIFT